MKSCHSNRLTVFFAAGLTLMPIAGICAGQNVQVRVSFPDLNLSTSQGISTLYGRLRWAAASVCGDEPANRELGFHAAWSRCVRTALDEAVVQVHSTGLAAIHAKHRGEKPPVLMAKGNSDQR